MTISRNQRFASLLLLLLMLFGTLAASADARPRRDRDRNRDRNRQTTQQTAQEVSTQADSAKPNVVIVMTDDMRDTDWQALPKTRAFFEQNGTFFPNFFVPASSCCPSRASTMTGLYPHNHQVYRNNDQNGTDPNAGWYGYRRQGHEASNLARWMKGGNYRTALIGKYLNGYGDANSAVPVPLGWDQWVALTGLDYVNYELAENGERVQYANYDQYITTILRNRAIAFADQTQAPMFLYWSQRAPHSPWTPNRPYEDAYMGVTVERTPSFNEADVSDKPAYVRNRPAFTPNQIVQIDADERQRLRTLRSVDDAFQAMVNKLTALGELDNTYIFFYSDNGYMLGHHRLLTKSYPYDGSSKIEMAAYGPGFAPGTTDNRIASVIDIAPTILDAADIPLRPSDGFSLLTPRTREGVVLENFGVNNDGNELSDARAFKAWRTLDYLYVENGTGEKELYDMNADPWQLDNLLATWAGHTPTPENVAIGERLAAEMNTAFAANPQ